MSDIIGRPLKSSPSLHKRSSTLRGRLIVFALLAAICALVALAIAAWIDGGEQPIRPIVQQVVLPSGEQVS